MPPDEPTLYSLGIQIATLSGKIDGYQAASLARETALSVRLDDSRVDRERIHSRLDKLDERQDGFERWRNRIAGGLALLALLVVAVGGAVLMHWKP